MIVKFKYKNAITAILLLTAIIITFFTSSFTVYADNKSDLDKINENIRLFVAEEVNNDTQRTLSDSKWKTIYESIKQKRNTLIHGMGGSENASDVISLALNEEGNKGDKYWNGCKAWGGGGADWCAIFIGWLIEQCNLNPDEYGWSASVPIFHRQAKAKNFTIETQGGNDTYKKVKAGDIVIFSGDVHVGICVEKTNDTIVTMEGNSGNSNTNPYFKGSTVVKHTNHTKASNNIIALVRIPWKTTSGDLGGTTIKGGMRTKAPTTSDPAYNPPINNWPSMFDHGANCGNCTAYAWGRVYEAEGIKLNINGNAGDWWTYGGNNYTKGQEPKVGAVCVWSGNGAGHVAFVEKVIDKNTIVISESGWSSFRFRTQTVTKSSGWGWGGSYRFLGFIYPKK